MNPKKKKEHVYLHKDSNGLLETYQPKTELHLNESEVRSLIHKLANLNKENLMNLLENAAEHQLSCFQWIRRELLKLICSIMKLVRIVSKAEQ